MRGRKFKLENLPKDVREKIHDIYFVGRDEMADEDVIGECNLNDGWLLDGETHYLTFTSRQALIDDIRHCVEAEF